MIKIKALQDFEYSLDGINVTKFKKDQEYEIDRKSAKILTKVKKIDIMPGDIENIAHNNSLKNIVKLEKTILERDKTIVAKDKEILALEKKLEKFNKKAK